MKLSCIDKAHQSILKFPTADKYGHIWWTDQKTNQSNYRKKIMSSKEKHNWAIRAEFSSCRKENLEARLKLIKNFKFFPSAVKIILESNWKRFRKIAKRENFNLKPDPQMRKTRSTYHALILSWTVEKRKCIQFPSLMSGQHLSLRSMTCMHFKNFKFFSSLRRPKTFFRQQQGHQLPCAILGSINFLEKTSFAVDGGEHQKADNIEKQTMKTEQLVIRINQELFHR